MQAKVKYLGSKNYDIRFASYIERQRFTYKFTYKLGFLRRPHQSSH